MTVMDGEDVVQEVLFEAYRKLGLASDKRSLSQKSAKMVGRRISSMSALGQKRTLDRVSGVCYRTRAAPKDFQSRLSAEAGEWAPRLPLPMNCRGSSYLSLSSAFEHHRRPAGWPLRRGRGQSGILMVVTARETGSRVWTPAVDLGKELPRICPGSYPSSCHSRQPRRPTSGSRLR